MAHPLDAQVDFRDDAEEVEADGDDGGPKRAVHGRKATAFVKKGKAVGAWNLSPTADGDWWSLCDYVLEVVMHQECQWWKEMTQSTTKQRKGIVYKPNTMEVVQSIVQVV